MGRAIVAPVAATKTVSRTANVMRMGVLLP